MGEEGRRWWSGLVVLAVACAVAGPVGAEGEGSGGEEAFAEAAGGAAGGLRPPADIRQGPILFEGDLEPVGEQRARRLLGALCAEEPVRDEEHGWHCSTCPVFTSQAGKRGPLTLEQSVEGSFLKKGKKEIFATYRGCEPEHAAEGGAVIFRKHKGSWATWFQHPGLRAQQCLAFRSDKHRDRLVCRLRYVSDNQVIEKVVDAAGGGRYRLMARSTDNTGQCPTHKFVSSYLKGWRREDLDGDGRPDLLVEKIQRYRPLNSNRDAKGRPTPVCRLDQVGGQWHAVRRFEIEFHYDGERLKREEFRRRALGAGR